MSQTTVETQYATLKLNGESGPPRLDPKAYPRLELTPAIGLRFEENFKLADVLKKTEEEKDTFFKALAFEISLNGLAVFPKQADLGPEGLEEVAAYLNKYSGASDIGGFHIHPIQAEFDTTKKGGHVFAIGGPSEAKLKAFRSSQNRENRSLAARWHTDISFEARPATYSLLQVNTLPRTGGDTLFLSNYAAYDKLSPPLQKLVEGLTATHSGEIFHGVAKNLGRELNAGPRGAPENVGTELISHHPVVRTNPLTGLKALFVNPEFTRYIDDLTFDESEALLGYIFKLQTQSHDISVRHKWDKHDLAIWDNRSTSHSATFDYGTATRIADRITVIGEKPFFDKNSISRKEYDEKHPQRLDLPEIQL